MVGMLHESGLWAMGEAVGPNIRFVGGLDESRLGFSRVLVVERQYLSEHYGKYCRREFVT